MNLLRFITIQVVLFSASACFAADTSPLSEKDKAAVLHQTAQDWLDVGLAQSKKGLYKQAEKSFLAAQEYQEYLTVAELKQLEQSLVQARQAMVEKQPVSEHLKTARELVKQGQPLQAKAHYEKASTSPYLTEQERKQMEQEIKVVDAGQEKQMREMTDLYNSSVQFYRAGEIEKARDGFVEVAKYGMLDLPKGETAEDYLVRIDSILTAPFKAVPDSNHPMSSVEPQAALPAGEVALLKPGPEKPPVKKQADEQTPVNQMPETTTEVVAAPEPPAKTEASSAEEQKVAPENKVEAAPAEDPRVKIARTYTKAVVEDAAARVEYHISRGELDKAVSVVRTATLTIKEYRSLIGDDLFTQYSIQLKQLADKIAKVHKAS